MIVRTHCSPSSPVTAEVAEICRLGPEAGWMRILRAFRDVSAHLRERGVTGTVEHRRDGAFALLTSVAREKIGVSGRGLPPGESDRLHARHLAWMDICNERKHHSAEMLASLGDRVGPKDYAFADLSQGAGNLTGLVNSLIRVSNRIAGRDPADISDMTPEQEASVLEHVITGMYIAQMTFLSRSHNCDPASDSIALSASEEGRPAPRDSEDPTP